MAVLAVAQIILAFIALVLGLATGIWVFREARRIRSRKLTIRAYGLLIGGALLGAGLFWPAVAYLYTEHLWYQNIGLESVFWRIQNARWGLFARFAGLGAVFMFINFFIAERLCPVSREFQRWTRQRTNDLRRVVIVLIVLISCALAAPMMRLWNEHLLHKHQTPFGHNRLSQVTEGKGEVVLTADSPLRALTATEKGTFYIASDDQIYAAYEDRDGWNRFDITRDIDRPRAMTLGPDGWLYVSSGSRIYRVHPNQKGVEIWADGLSSPRGLAFSQDGSLYVAEYGRNRISRLFDMDDNGRIEGDEENSVLLSNDADARQERVRAVLEAHTHLFDIPSLFETELAADTVSEALKAFFGSEQVTLSEDVTVLPGERADSWILVEEDTNRRHAVTKDDSGLHVSIPKRRWQSLLVRLEAGERSALDELNTYPQIQFTPDEQELMQGLSERLSGPVGLAFAAEENSPPFLYIAEWGSGEISRVNLDTGTFSRMADGLSSPRDLDFDPDGVLHVVQTGSNEVSRIPEAGTVLRVAHGFSNPMSLAFGQESGLHVAESVGTDPIFNREIGFYMFTLPIWHWFSVWLKVIFWITLLGGGLVYNFYYNRDPQSMMRVQLRVIKHGSLLWLGLLAISVWRSQINIWQLLNRHFPNSHVYGIGYSQKYGQIPGYRIYMALVIVIALVVLLNMFWRKKALWYVAAATWAISYPLLVWALPFLVLRLRVRPNEQRVERPFIQHNINGTRRGFALDQVRESHLLRKQAKLATIEAHPETLQNLQLWDRRVLYQHLRQGESLRAYYEFHQFTDVDRYYIGDQYRQVLLAPREINYDEIVPRTWVNERLKFTHGYGLCVAPVNEFTQQGDPILWVKGIPLTNAFPDGKPIPELEVQRPEIYYGELMGGITDSRRNDYALVNTDEDEIDYTVALEGGEQKQVVRYQGQGGVPLGPGWSFRRLAFVWRFGRLNFLLTRALKPSSRIMFRRQVLHRAKTIAPFLECDRDPYVVVGNDGQLWWVIDLFVKSKEYPYSEPFTPPFIPPDETLDIQAFNGSNYVRNPGVVVINAYDGKVQYYLEESDEPLSRAYRSAFPELFKSMEEIPSGIEHHIRYPDTLTLIQASRYTRYHMKDPDLFYPNDDLWYLPEEVNGSQQGEDVPWVPMVPYYTVLTLPGEDKPEFVNMIPFRPPGARDAAKRMTAWMVARCDPPHYGELMVYTLPRDQVVDSPEQVESRIGQDVEISEKFTVWGQGGSSVIRGNLLVIPVEESLFYVEPLYLQAGGAPVPQLKQVVVVAEDNLAMGASFNEALRRVFVGNVVTEPTQTADGSVTTDEKPTREMLIQTAMEGMKTYHRLMGEGRYAEAADAAEAANKAWEALNTGDYQE